MQLANAALLLIDLQKAIDDPRWAAEGPRNNPAAESTSRVCCHWREAGRPIFHIRHDFREPNSTYRPGQPGNGFKPEATPLPGETVIAKQTNSAFIGTDLEAQLRARGIRRSRRRGGHHQQLGGGHGAHGRQPRLHCSSRRGCLLHLRPARLPRPFAQRRGGACDVAGQSRRRVLPGDEDRRDPRLPGSTSHHQRIERQRTPWGPASKGLTSISARKSARSAS